MKTVQGLTQSNRVIDMQLFDDILMLIFIRLAIGFIRLMLSYKTILDTRHHFGQMGLYDVVVSSPALFII